MYPAGGTQSDITTRSLNALVSDLLRAAGIVAGLAYRTRRDETWLVNALRVRAGSCRCSLAVRSDRSARRDRRVEHERVGQPFEQTTIPCAIKLHISCDSLGFLAVFAPGRRCRGAAPPARSNRVTGSAELRTPVGEVAPSPDDVTTRAGGRDRPRCYGAGYRPCGAAPSRLG